MIDPVTGSESSTPLTIGPNARAGGEEIMRARILFHQDAGGRFGLGFLLQNGFTTTSTTIAASNTSGSSLIQR